MAFGLMDRVYGIENFNENKMKVIFGLVGIIAATSLFWFLQYK